MLTLAQLPEGMLRHRLSGDGLRLRTGPLVFCIRSKVPEVLQGLTKLYGHYEVVDADTFADFHIAVQHRAGLRRWLRPQLSFPRWYMASNYRS